jgi:predicted component of type VI protein secretion system
MTFQQVTLQVVRSSLSRFTRGQSINITLREGAKFVIGRDESCDLALPDNKVMYDDYQFLLTLHKGNVYAAELAKKRPTKIRCMPF